MVAARRASQGFAHGRRGLLTGGSAGLVLALSAVVWLSLALGDRSAADRTVRAVSTAAAQAEFATAQSGGELGGNGSSFISTGGLGESPRVSKSDVDGDGISNELELKSCGSLTCAERWSDTDHDSIPAFVEVDSCGTTSCASSTADFDRDSIPDYAERLICGNNWCASGTEDVDRDGVADWAELVICGTQTCSTGLEDYNRDGVSDAAQLMACIRYPSRLAQTGSTVAPWFVVAAAIGAVGAGVWLIRSSRLARAATRPLPQLAAGSDGQPS